MSAGSSALGLACPRCGAPLADEPRACAGCGRAFGRVHGLVDLREETARARAPWPLASGVLAPWIARLDAGEPWKQVFEELLLALAPREASRLMQLAREGRAAWLSLLEHARGRVLVLANALSGTIVPLARAGFELVVLDPAPERAALARGRDAAHAPGRVTQLVGGEGERLPFADASFALVVREEGGLPQRVRPSLAECRRVCAGELVWTVDNRLAYKRAGADDEYRALDPLRWLVRALRPRPGEGTLAGLERALAGPGFARVRRFALYPHARQFTNVVGLDGEPPRLVVGPKERANRLKVAAKRAGLFPVLTPSFALVASRAESGTRGARTPRPARPTRVERLLAMLAERCGEPLPELEHVLSTRGNSSIVHTRRAGAEAGDARGRWTLHVPLCPRNKELLGVHARCLREIPRRFPGVPVPELLFEGELEGLWLTCERRLGGLPALQHSGDLARMQTMLLDEAESLARLVVRAPAPLGEEVLAREVDARLAAVLPHAGSARTAQALRELAGELRERLAGLVAPLVYAHCDLRPKHVMVDETGRVQGYLDWATTEEPALPGYDLVHTLLQERKQAEELSAGAVWRLARAGRLRAHERLALERYAELTATPWAALEAVLLGYPLLVAATAERGWDYSRPRWIATQFEL